MCLSLRFGLRVKEFDSPEIVGSCVHIVHVPFGGQESVEVQRVHTWIIVHVSGQPDQYVTIQEVHGFHDAEIGNPCGFQTNRIPGQSDVYGARWRLKCNFTNKRLGVLYWVWVLGLIRRLGLCLGMNWIWILVLGLA